MSIHTTSSLISYLVAFSADTEVAWVHHDMLSTAHTCYTWWSIRRRSCVSCPCLRFTTKLEFNHRVGTQTTQCILHSIRIQSNPLIEPEHQELFARWLATSCYDRFLTFDLQNNHRFLHSGPKKSTYVISWTRCGWPNLTTSTYTFTEWRVTGKALRGWTSFTNTTLTQIYWWTSAFISMWSRAETSV